MLRDPDKNLLEETRECMRMTNLAFDIDRFHRNLDRTQELVIRLAVLKEINRVDPLTAAPVIDYVMSLSGLKVEGPTDPAAMCGNDQHCYDIGGFDTERR